MANKIQTKFELKFNIKEMLKLKNTDAKKLCSDGSLNEKTIYRAMKNGYATLDVCLWLSNKLDLPFDRYFKKTLNLYSHERRVTPMDNANYAGSNMGVSSDND